MSEATKAPVHLLSAVTQTPVLGTNSPAHITLVSIQIVAHKYIHHRLSEEEEDGTLRIGLDFSLRVSTAGPERAAPAAVHPPRERKQVKRLKKMKMPGLLHLLWENTGLNEWAPWLEGKRRLTTVMSRLQNEASSIKQGYTVLGDVLLLQENGYANKKAVTHAYAESRRLIVISELNAWSPTLNIGNN